MPIFAKQKFIHIFVTIKNRSMKKSIALFFAAFALSGAGFQAQAGDFLNHLGVGATAGTDAIGFQAAVPLGKHAGFRAAYVSGCNIGYDRSFHVDMDAKWDDNDISIHDDIAMRATLVTKDFRGILDLYPFKNAGFHLSLGVYCSLGSTRFLEIGNTSPLPIPEEEYHTSGVSINGQFVTTDEQGLISAGVHFPSVRPYAGIGFGRPVRSDSRVTVTFDLGACYLGAPTLQLTDYYGKPVIVTSEAVQDLDKGWIDKVLGYAKFYPVVNLGLHVRLF